MTQTENKFREKLDSTGAGPWACDFLWLLACSRSEGSSNCRYKHSRWAFSERCQSGRGHATHLRCSTNILPSRCFNDWRFANRAKPSDGNCASRGQAREAFALAGGWLCVEGARWLPGIYRPLAGRGPARGERESKPPWSGSKTCEDPATLPFAVLLSDRLSPLVPSPPPASFRSKCFGPASHHN